MKLDNIQVVCQGAYRPETTEVIQNYLNAGLPVIYSGWVGQPCPLTHKNLSVCYSNDPENPGVENRNRQIVSSLRGLEQVTTKYAWKVRSDQILPVDTIHKIHEFVTKYEGLYPNFMEGPIFVAGNYRLFPFHPRDHIFIGHTKDVKDLFDIPLDHTTQSNDYTKWLRAEAWIGANYLAKHNSNVAFLLHNFQEFLVDNAPQIGYARELSEAITPAAFKALPRIKFSWPKHGLQEYHYHVGKSYSEYWDES